MALLGIDFGTATVRAVVVPRDGRPKAGDLVEVPALATARGDSMTVGEAALMMAGAVDEPIVSDVKRMLGRAADDAQVKRLVGRAQLMVRPAGDDLELYAPESGDAPGLSVSRACGALLRHAGELASDGQLSHEAVIAIPAWYGPAQRAALALAAARVDIKVLRFVRDSFASALWASHTYRVDGTIATVDAGAGGVSVTVARVGESVALLAAHGSSELGGIDIDAELSSAAMERADRQTRELLRTACEALKRSLARADHAQQLVRLPHGESRTISAERWEIDLLLGAIASAIAQSSERVLAEAKLKSGALDAVLATGGMATLAAISGQVVSSLGRIVEGFPLTAGPALGAALRAAYAAGRLEGPDIHDGEAQPAQPRAEPRPPVRQSDPRVNQAQVFTRRKPVERHRPDVRRHRTTEPRYDERKSAAPPPPKAPAPAAPSIPDPPKAPPAPVREPIAPLPRNAPRNTPAQPRPRQALRSSAPVMSARDRADALAIDHAVPVEPATLSVPSAMARPAASGVVAAESRPASPSEQPEATMEESAPPFESGPPHAVLKAESSPPTPPPVWPAVPPAPGDARQTIPWSEARDVAAQVAARVQEVARNPSLANKYPARDGQRKYPARDTAGRAEHAARRQRETAPSAPSPSSDPPPSPKRDVASDPPRAPVRRPTNIGIPFAAPAPSEPPEAPRDAGDSIAPGAGRHSIIPAPQVPTSGTLYKPQGAAVLNLAMTRPLVREDLEPIALPVLLRRLMGRRTVSGTLVLHGDRRELPIDVESGNALLTKGEHTELVHFFDQPEGTWKLVDKRTKLAGRELHPLPRVALEGLRRSMRSLPSEVLIEKLGERLHMAPRLLPEHATVAKRLALSGRERRFVNDYIDGEASALALSKQVLLGPQTCFQLLALLELYSVIEWLPSSDGGRVSTPGSMPPPR